MVLKVEYLILGVFSTSVHSYWVELISVFISFCIMVKMLTMRYLDGVWFLVTCRSAGIV